MMVEFSALSGHYCRNEVDLVVLRALGLYEPAQIISQVFSFGALITIDSDFRQEGWLNEKLSV